MVAVFDKYGETHTFLLAMASFQATVDVVRSDPSISVLGYRKSETQQSLHCTTSYRIIIYLTRSMPD